MWMAIPFLDLGSPAPDTVRNPLTQSRLSPALGRSKGFQRIWIQKHILN
jgi:hypothetical protein